MNKQIILDAFQGLTGTGTAFVDMNKFLGSVLEKITLQLAGGALTKSMITSIQLKGNSKVLWESSGARCDLTNLYNGGVSDSTILKIDFMDRKAMTVNAKQAGAIDLSVGSGIKTLRLEITLSGATTPAITGFCDVSPPTNDPSEALIRPLIARRHAATYVAPAAGTFVLPVPHLNPSEGGSTFRRIYLFSSNITNIKTIREGNIEHELTKLGNEHSQKENGKTPQAGLVVFDPCQDLQMTGRVWDTRKESGIQSASLQATFSAGETITIETEELLPFAPY